MEESAQKVGVGSHGVSATTRRTITVHANSEIACKPDLFSLEIVVTSTKETAETAQSSVKRRSEYILQVLRKNSIKEKRIDKSTSVNRFGEDEVCVQVHYLAQSDCLQSCEAARNVLVEKMDAAVECGMIELLYSPAHKARKRQEAFTGAVSNAREKAASVAQMLQVRLGPAVEVMELTSDTRDCSVINTSTSHEATTAQPPTSPPEPTSGSLNHLQRMREATLICTSQVQVTFEVLPTRTCNHRKCPKH